VAEGTIRNDVRNDCADSAEKLRTKKRADASEKNIKPAEAAVEAPRETFETIIVDPPWPMAKIERDVRPNQPAGNRQDRGGEPHDCEP
jgi:hypothetical protein